MGIIFWTSILALTYTYFGYPLYIYIKAKFSRRNILKDFDYQPFVSIVFSAYNEEKFIGKKIINLLNSTYPKDKMEILVGSDGSEDRTNEILSQISDKRVKAFIFPKRRGKVSILNELMPKAKGEILVFCDARQLFDQDAIGNLVSNFVNDRVGCVSGELVFTSGARENGVTQGVGVYWEYEKFIRKCESAVHSMIGATGAIYAIRNELYSPPPENTILDDVYIPLFVMRRGYRCVLDTKAKAYDRPSLTAAAEYRRKVRTLCGNYQIFGMFKDMFIPFKSAAAIPFFSHKFLRVMAPFFMIAAFLSNLFIAKNALYVNLLAIQVFFYSLAILGILTYKHKNKKAITKLPSIAYMFCQMNFAAVAGLYRFIFNKQRIVWEK